VGFNGPLGAGTRLTGAGLAVQSNWVRGVKTGKIALNSRPNPAGDRDRLANRDVLTEIS